MKMIRKIIPEKLRNDKKMLFILGIGLLGMLLLLFSTLPLDKSEKTGGDFTEKLTLMEKEAEKKLETLLSTVNGVGKVKAIDYSKIS